MRMNALDYVHDVCGENEREAVNSEEDRTPRASQDSPLSPPRGSRCESSFASPLPASSSVPSVASPGVESPNAVTNESQESRVYVLYDASPRWDDK